MTVDRRVSSIESSFKMESMPFDAECRQRVRNVLTKKVSATDAISELNKKYRVSKKKVEGSRVWLLVYMWATRVQPLPG